MDNQHQKIKGYRDLSQEEIDLMNEIKSLAEQAGALISKLEEYPGTAQGFDPVTVEGKPSLDKRWIAQAKTSLQNGFMQLVRGVAQPSTF